MSPEHPAEAPAGPTAEAATGEHDVVELVTPVGRDWDAVARLVLAGVGERLHMSVEEVDDLQLAVERLLLEAGPADEQMCMVLEIDPGRMVRVRLGPLRERSATAALRAPDPPPGQLGLRRILQTVVDSFDVEDGPDGGVVVRLEKAGRV